MARLEIVKIGHPVLRKPAEEVKPEMLKEPGFQKLLRDMADTMRHADGAGLAANQVGCNHQVVVLGCDANARYPGGAAIPLQTFLNLVILEYSKDTEEDWEGCLSIPGYRGLVSRSKKVVFEALTEKGENVRRTVEGFEARIIQHEADHLNGLFYVDRMGDLKRWIHLAEFNKKFGTHVHEE